MANPRVFISYSWDSEDHRAWVLMLADQLVAKGVNIQFDQYGIKIGRNITQNMELNISDVDKVIIIFTEKYLEKAKNKKGGVGFEYSMIIAEVYDNQANNTKFIPVLRSGTSKVSIPNAMKNYLYTDMREGADFEKAFDDVLRAIYDKPRILQPKLGEIPDLPQRDQSYEPPISTILSSKDENIGAGINKSSQLHEVKKTLRRLLRADDLEGALNTLGDYADDQENNKLGNEVTLLFARFNSMKNESAKGLLSPDQATMRKNRIQHAIVSTIEGLK